MGLYEIIGIWASFLILVSFLMKRIVVIRLVNICGAVLFVIYGALIGAWAIWIFNTALIIVHLVYLSSHFAKKKNTVAAKAAENGAGGEKTAP